MTRAARRLTVGLDVVRADQLNLISKKRNIPVATLLDDFIRMQWGQFGFHGLPGFEVRRIDGEGNVPATIAIEISEARPHGGILMLPIRFAADLADALINAHRYEASWPTGGVAVTLQGPGVVLSFFAVDTGTGRDAIARPLIKAVAADLGHLIREFA